MRRQVSLGFVIWLVVGLVVAANDGFLSHLDSLSGVLSAVLAVLVAAAHGSRTEHLI